MPKVSNKAGHNKGKQKMKAKIEHVKSMNLFFVDVWVKGGWKNVQSFTRAEDAKSFCDNMQLTYTMTDSKVENEKNSCSW